MATSYAAPADGGCDVFALSLPSAVKFIFLCVPSQNGLFDEAPQRQRKVSVVRVTVRPVPLTTSSAPLIMSGPLRNGLMESVPLRAASALDSCVAGSPVAENAAAAWLPSHNGLRFDAPQRHRVARKARSCPSIARSA